MGLLIITAVSGMFLKGLCAKGLVLSVAVLKRGGAFKRRGSVGGLGSRELCIPRRSQEAGIFLFRSYLSHEVRCSAPNLDARSHHKAGSNGGQFLPHYEPK